MELMKQTTRLMFVIAVAAVLVFAMASSALADHSPTFYVEWNAVSSFSGYGGTTFGNAGAGGPGFNAPHANYLEGTEKCAVCHSVHRAPVPGETWTTSGTPGAQSATQKAQRTKVAGGQYNRAEWVSDSANTEMLLIDNVANSCNFCHVYTSIGVKQLYAGNVNYINSETGLPGSEWDEGFGHHNSCTGCHAQHGVSNNFGNPTLYGTYGTYQGTVRSKVLKVRAKGSGGAVGSAAEYLWQDEVIVAGSAGKADAQLAFGAFWANKLNVDNTRVDSQNVPLFPSATDAIMGTNVRPDADIGDAQVSTFCTFCHQNYGYASEATVNPNGTHSLFQGPWYALAGTVPNVTGAAGTWQTMNGANAYGAPFKNHPVKATSENLGTTFAAAGKSAALSGPVAFANASTCRSCHDAGVENSTGVIVESWPHFTPGYFHFTKTAANAGSSMTYAPPIPDQINSNNTALITSTQAWLNDPTNYAKAVTVADGQCLKCHVNATNDAGVGKTF